MGLLAVRLPDLCECNPVSWQAASKKKTAPDCSGAVGESVQSFN
jgi:hypothetical protein